MQLRASFLRRAAKIAAPALALHAAASPAAASIDGHEVSYVFQFFSDSDDVNVVSSTGDYGMSLSGDSRVDVQWKHETVIVPGVDAVPGTSEAVDAITAASRPIVGADSAFREFAKSRNEIEGGVRWKGLTGGYYVSQEEDYFAQQISGSAGRSLFGDVTLSIGGAYGWDRIEPLADDDGISADDSKTTLHLNAIATRAITPTTEVQFGAEMTNVEGLQHNPYRNVYVAGANVHERHPDSRSRRDAFVKLSQYLMNRSSARVSYMMYDDDWGVSSQTLNATLHQYVTEPVRVRYHYRYYSQNAADFWRDEYTDPNGVGGFQTGDYRLSAFSAHLLGARMTWSLGRPFGIQALEGVRLSFEYERYFNTHNFSANLFESGITFTF